jgi:hypothetical protein
MAFIQRQKGTLVTAHHLPDQFMIIHAHDILF